jgi:hypothetical protein
MRLRIRPRRKHRAERVAAVRRAAVDSFLPPISAACEPRGAREEGGLLLRFKAFLI